MLIVMRGISGSGKSMVADALHNRKMPENLPGASPLGQWMEETIRAMPLERRKGCVSSADEYFTGPDGVYRFDPKYLAVAHGVCFRNVTEALMAEASVVVVANTSCSIVEVAPYAAMAQAFGKRLLVCTLLADPMTAWRRNVHDVPLSSIVKQDAVLRQSIASWPSWWPQEIFPL